MKTFQTPSIVKTNIDKQISLGMTSPTTPPEDPFASIDIKKMLEINKIENAQTTQTSEIC